VSFPFKHADKKNKDTNELGAILNPMDKGHRPGRENLGFGEETGRLAPRHFAADDLDDFVKRIPKKAKNQGTKEANQDLNPGDQLTKENQFFPAKAPNAIAPPVMPPTSSLLSLEGKPK
jgi:hypothetical protein